MPRATTGTWRSPIPSATACSTATSRTVEAIAAPNAATKVVAYLSAEFLTGPHLGNSLLASASGRRRRQALSSVGQDLSDAAEQEEEPGLGNGGLGRLAACYMDSLATLNVPAIGYGIRYEFGIFDQAIRDGWQVELTDKWLRFGNPWEIVRSEITLRREVRRTHRILPRRAGTLSGALAAREGGEGCRLRHAGARAIACRRRTCCGCGRRRRRSRSTSTRSTSATTTAPSTRRSHPKPSRRCCIRTTSPRPARQLRLAQQYFFVSCSLQDMIRLHLAPRQAAATSSTPTGPRS